MKKQSSSSTHIVIASDDDREELMSIDKGSNTVRWIVPKKSAIGDRLLFFHRGVGLLGEGVLTTPPEEAQMPNRYGATAAQVSLFKHPLTAEELHEQLPDWGWPTYPRSYTTVPPNVLPELERLIDSCR